MTMKEKLLQKKEAAERRNNVDIYYRDGSHGTTTVVKLLKEKEAPSISNELATVMSQKYAANYASRMLAEMLQAESVFGFVKLHESDIMNLNDSLKMIGIDTLNVGSDGGVFRIVKFSALVAVATKVNSLKCILMDVITDMTGDKLGLGYVKVWKYYVPCYQVTNAIMPISCTMKNGETEIEIDMDPSDMIDLVNSDAFIENTCSLEQAIERAIAYLLLDEYE